MEASPEERAAAIAGYGRDSVQRPMTMVRHPWAARAGVGLSRLPFTCEFVLPTS